MTTSIGDTVERAPALLGPLDWNETSVNGRGEVVLPSGTVTLLLADVEGSTRGWEERAQEMTGALEALGEVVDATLGWHQGVRPVEQGEGDSFVAAFSRASDALACALEIQRQLTRNSLRLRMGVHTGEVQLRDEGNYVGPALNRTARLRDAAHGGQVVLSQATCELVRDRLPRGAALRDLGVHRLKDLGRPEHVYQLVHPDVGDDFPPLRSVDHLPNNLPAQLTSFVGREPELAVLRKLLGETRMLTLTGSGGCGKTRLALELAARALERFPDGTWLVELTPITDASLVPSAVAAAVGAREQQGRRALDALVDDLASQTALVLLDNCEHLVDATAEVAERILLACPGVVVLATSREQLGVPGETAWRVPSLSFPSAQEPRLDTLARYEAVQLFLERACKVRPNFGLDDTTAAAVAAICQRLDGVPLAVELAAARTRVLSPQQILDGLDDRFRLLTGGARTAVARQQTLRASVDWSYELLTDSERRLFARLSVFAGGFSLDAAEAVAGAEPVGAFAVLDLLQSLADRSLLVVADSPRSSADGVRYRMLETIRQYAGERLAASDEADIVRTGYCEFYVALAERAALHLERAEQETWADMLDVEQENVRVAFEHAHDRADADRALRFIAALFWYWVIRGHLRIGAKACRLALDLPGPVRPQVRAAALVAACHVGWFRVDASVIPLAQEAVELAREAGDRLLEGRALFHTGVWAAEGGGRVEDLETSIAIAREVGDRWGLALGLAAAGSALGDADRTAAAAPVLEEGLAVCEELGERYIANTIRYKLAGAQFRLGRTAEGEAMLRGVIAHARGTRDVYSLAAALADLGLSRAVQGSIDAGIEMLVEDVALLQGSRQTWPNHEMQAYGILGHLLFKAGRFEEARGPLETAESTGRAHSPLTDGVLALTLSLRARVEHALGEPDHARALTAEALTLVGDARTWPAVSTRHNAACIALDDGDLDTAERMTHEALATAAGADGKQASFVEALPVLDTLAVITDDPARGARLLGAVDALMEYARHVRDAYTRERYDAAVKRYRDELGADAFDAAVEEGARLSLEEAIAYAQRGRGQRRRSARGWDSLTPTELEVVKLVREGLSNPDIAERLFVSRKTVTTHLTHVFAKLGVSSRSELAVAATRRGV